MNLHLAIRADGGPDIGYGHLFRSGALAETVLDRGGRITYVTTTPHEVDAVCPAGVETVELPARGEPEPAVTRLSETAPDVVFTDAYPVDTDYQRAVRAQAPLVVMQDDARHAVCADAFVNGNLNADDLEYEFVDSASATYLGPDYLLLREEIRRLASREPPWHPTPSRALVTMGGSDMAGLTPTVVRAFDGVDLRVDAIVGPGCSSEREQAVREAAAATSTDVRVVRNPDDLPDRMFEADFAIATASTTTYELLALGTPLVCLPVADNQVPIADALDASDGALVLDRDAGRTDFSRAIETYLADQSLRKRRRAWGRELVDGRGAERIADIVSGFGGR